MKSQNFLKKNVSLLLFALIIACSANKDNALGNKMISSSPNEEVTINEYTYKEDGIYHLALYVDFGLGGAGLFDIETTTARTCKVIWTSEDSIKIMYPSDAKIIRKEDKVYYLGRTIVAEYEQDLDKI